MKFNYIIVDEPKGLRNKIIELNLVGNSLFFNKISFLSERTDILYPINLVFPFCVFHEMKFQD